MFFWIAAWETPNSPNRCLGALEASGPGHIETITRHARAGEAKAAGDAAHALKGAAGIIGAEPLRALAAEIEAAGKVGKYRAGGGFLLQDIQTEMRHCLDYIPEIRESFGEDELTHRSTYPEAANIMKILVVDDDESSRLMIAHALRESGI